MQSLTRKMELNRLDDLRKRQETEAQTKRASITKHFRGSVAKAIAEHKVSDILAKLKQSSGSGPSLASIVGGASGKRASSTGKRGMVSRKSSFGG